MDGYGQSNRAQNFTGGGSLPWHTTGQGLQNPGITRPGFMNTPGHGMGGMTMIGGPSNHIPPRSPFIPSHQQFSTHGYQGSGPYFPYSDGVYPGFWQSNMVQGITTESGPAFQSIEYIVRSLSSTTHMLESTFHAVYSSFHSVLAVSQQLGQLKSRFSQIFSIYTIIRGFKWCVYKLMGLLGLHHPMVTTDSLWHEVNPVPTETSSNSYKIYTYLFFALVYIGPYLLWRIQSYFGTPNELDWRNLEDRRNHLATVLFAYQAAESDEMNVERNQTVAVAPSHLQLDRNWLLVSDGHETGIVPANYLAMGTDMQPSSKNTSTSSG